MRAIFVVMGFPGRWSGCSTTERSQPIECYKSLQPPRALLFTYPCAPRKGERSESRAVSCYAAEVDARRRLEQFGRDPFEVLDIEPPQFDATSQTDLQKQVAAWKNDTVKARYEALVATSKASLRISKLLRLAEDQAGTPEGNSAKAQAERVQERIAGQPWSTHEVAVLTEAYEIIVDHVIGHYLPAEPVLSPRPSINPDVLAAARRVPRQRDTHFYGHGVTVRLRPTTTHPGTNRPTSSASGFRGQPDRSAVAGFRGHRKMTGRNGWRKLFGGS